MTMRDYGLYAAAFMILAGVTMLVVLWWEREKARREAEWKDWLVEEEAGLARVTEADQHLDVSGGSRLPMLEGQEPTR